jgi:DNA gyrase inhibitor GyrI
MIIESHRKKEIKMNDLEIKIVSLPPMKAVKFYGFGQSPENLAHEAANQWLEEQKLLQTKAFRHFGFNNPNPSEGSPNYGYEIWIVPEQWIPQDDGAKEVEFDGGLYAVAHCPSLEVIGEVWQNLVAWKDSSQYISGKHQWLEELIQPWEINRTEADLQFFLYLPIKE